jgi:hypothetical protein
MKNKIYDVIFFVGGAFIVVYSLFAGQMPLGGFSDWWGGAIAVGVSLIVIGFLRRSWNKKEKEK